MAYGSNITIGLSKNHLFQIGNTSAASYAPGDLAYDLAINGIPFILGINDANPYQRVTAPYKKQQFDQTNEPGEQSLTGWWLRSQSSFHSGSGIKYYDPSAGEIVKNRFTDSQNVDVWTKGQVSLLKACDPVHISTGEIRTNNTTAQIYRSIKYSGIDAVLTVDEYDVDKVYPTITATVSNKALTSNIATLTTSANHGFLAGMEVEVTGVDATFNGTYTIATVPSVNTFTYAKTATNVASTAATGTVTSSVTHFIDYNSGVEFPVYSICDDGTYAYWVTNKTSGGSNKLTVYKKALTGDESTAETQMFQVNGTTVVTATINYVKDRLVMCVNNSVHEFATNATSLPAAIYTNPTSTYTYTSITAAGLGIYVAGFNGIHSSINKFTIGSTGGMPTLSLGAVTVAEMPPGEIIHNIYYYLGYMLIGTSKGIRAAIVSDQDGSINYGSLIVETTQPCYDFAARDKFVWCATGINNNPGLIRIDLGNLLETETLRFAWANDLQITDITNHRTTAVAFLGETERIVFGSANASGVDGAVYIESDTEVATTGYLTTGRIRFNTLEPKHFQFIRPRGDITNGGLKIDSIDEDETVYNVNNFVAGNQLVESGVSYPTSSREYVSFKFTLSSDNSSGPIFQGYQIKALPATLRQRIIQYPVFCFDNETDKNGNAVGYEGSAYEKISRLEDLESIGDIVFVQDFRIDESYEAVIEQVSFVNSTSPSDRFSGFGGLLTIQVRKI